ncbi:TlyA family rRNA (cytidine-2'-O)-methyltransferase [Candidatus Woesebacteria bacterium]|nr:TlyA family rRNA (cytidine-2'-O)-methyltransferase [Candidatus Woesebacteria bacterium]
MPENSAQYASRAGEKLQFALTSFSISLSGLICADFGCSTGGFTDCMLQNGATHVYSVDTAYGELAWKLRNDPRVTVLERTNAMHVTLPQKVDFLTVDTSWTKQVLVLPNALQNLNEDGILISLIKPHYEAPKQYLRNGRLQDEKIDEVLQKVESDMRTIGIEIEKIIESPIVGEKGKNREFLALLRIISQK